MVEGAGIKVRQAFLLHIDKDYIYEGGPYDLGRLFRLEDVTKEARAFARRSTIPTVPLVLTGEQPPGN